MSNNSTLDSRGLQIMQVNCGRTALKHSKQDTIAAVYGNVKSSGLSKNNEFSVRPWNLPSFTYLCILFEVALGCLVVA